MDTQVRKHAAGGVVALDGLTDQVPGLFGARDYLIPDRALTFAVFGVCAPQGSKNGFAVKKNKQYTGKVAMVEGSKKVKPWRQDVKHAALEHLGPEHQPLTCAVDIEVTFFLARPQSHYRTGRFAHLLRDAAPTRPAVKPDVDKLLRSTLDALGEAGVFADDAQVTDVTARKRFADTRLPGALITVRATS